jgi:hypothetical protein
VYLDQICTCVQRSHRPEVLSRTLKGFAGCAKPQRRRQGCLRSTSWFAKRKSQPRQQRKSWKLVSLSRIVLEWSVLAAHFVSDQKAPA